MIQSSHVPDQMKKNICERASKALAVMNRIVSKKEELSVLNKEYKELINACETIMIEEKIHSINIDEHKTMILKDKSSVKALSKEFLEKYIEDFCCKKLKGVDPTKLSRMMVEYVMDARNSNKKITKCVHFKSARKNQRKRKIMDDDDVIDSNNNINHHQNQEVSVKLQNNNNHHTKHEEHKENGVLRTLRS